MNELYEEWERTYDELRDRYRDAVEQRDKVIRALDKLQDKMAADTKRLNKLEAVAEAARKACDCAEITAQLYDSVEALKEAE